ncbi:MAG: ABC transporter permease [Firmicutes bacterium]|nr:ABC transporter permease [Bacillota bacterium]MBQ6013533.1 ABC transporter permease [Bacillota bacterium]MBQ6261029.1 ABC transporter permease [Bacillota bacterium]MBR0114368.1 ABC transporter permease [Bacillota bacterium]
MSELFISMFPNAANYWDRFLESMEATFQMFFIAGLLTMVIGGTFGVLLIVTKPGGIRPNRIVHTVLEAVTNIFRSIPFIILLIFLIPFTRLIVGTSIGVRGAVVPLVFGAVPFFTRQVESALSDVDPGKIEAARAMGSGILGMIFRVYLKEALPDLIRVVTITAISTIGLTTSAGAVGAGGIGSFAINYGQNMHYQDIVNLCVILLLIIVSLIQIIGNTLARKTYNRELFKK